MDSRDDRAARLAAELRANLRKRKQQGRGTEAPAPPETPGEPAPRRR